MLFYTTDAVAFAEGAYNPVHPEVQNAVGYLIGCLIHKGDWSNAEVFAQFTFDGLRDRENEVNQDSGKRSL